MCKAKDRGMYCKKRFSRVRNDQKKKEVAKKVHLTVVQNNCSLVFLNNY